MQPENNVHIGPIFGGEAISIAGTLKYLVVKLDNSMFSMAHIEVAAVLPFLESALREQSNRNGGNL